MIGRKQIYKITYPHGMIYVGMDTTGDRLYVGSPSARALIAGDLGIDTALLPHNPLARNTVIAGSERDYTLTFTHLGLTFRKEILWASDTARDEVVRAWEKLMIRRLGANNPAIGYNRTPKYRAPA